jgi:hypothetical protein
MVCIAFKLFDLLVLHLSSIFTSEHSKHAEIQNYDIYIVEASAL